MFHAACCGAAKPLQASECLFSYPQGIHLNASSHTSPSLLTLKGTCSLLSSPQSSATSNSDLLPFCSCAFPAILAPFCHPHNVSIWALKSAWISLNLTFLWRLICQTAWRLLAGICTLTFFPLFLEPSSTKLVFDISRALFLLRHHFCPAH